MEGLIYSAINQPVAQAIPNSITTLLDVGCGNGNLGKFLIEQSHPNLQVSGITYHEKEAEQARTVYKQVWLGDLNTIDLSSLGTFDTIVCSHVLEHVYEPHLLLRKLKEKLNPGGKIVVALPNVLFWKQRIQFLKGNFKYSLEGGLMDITHFRFFDWETAQLLLKNEGFHIVNAEAHGSFPMPVIRQLLGPLGPKLDAFFVKSYPGLFGFQFVFVAQKA